MKHYIFHVSGTHCASCKLLIEDSLQDHEGIKNVHVDIKKEIIHIDTDQEVPAEDFAATLTTIIKPHGYTLSIQKQNDTNLKESSQDLWKAIPLGLVFLVLFFGLQKTGLLDFGIGGDSITPSVSFMIGLIASISSCLAIVGGLILSISAQATKTSGVAAKKPLFLFHSGRIIGFALLGGVLGIVGHTVGITPAASSLLGILAAIVMILLGGSLVGIFKSNSFTLPSIFFTTIRKIEHTTLAPLLLGVGTFFLPCGFTQSMQIAALSSGSFVSGMGLMLAFALGTLPVLTLVSFGSVSFAQSPHASIFFKTAGVIVIGLGIVALLSGLAGMGIIRPLFTL